MSNSFTELKEDVITSFLYEAGWQYAKMEPIKADCSFRKYTRLYLGSKSAILMEAPYPYDDMTSFAQMASYLHQAGLSAPIIFSINYERGLMLLEDLGGKTFLDFLPLHAIAQSNLELEIKYYEIATDLLSHLHLQPLPSFPLKKIDFAFIISELMIGIEYYIEKWHGVSLSTLQKEIFYRFWEEKWPHMEDKSPVVVLRDYHSPNLLWMENRASLQKIGIIDFQDGMIGPRCYDLMSLLAADPRREVPKKIQSQMFTRYLQHLPKHEHSSFSLGYLLWTLERNIKCCGIFARQHVLYDNSNYLRLLPALHQHIVETIEHFPDLRQWWEALNIDPKSVFLHG